MGLEGKRTGMRWACDVALVLALGIAFTGPASGGNDRSFFMGNESAMTAGAGVAVTRDSDAVWYNPAGIGGTDRGKLDISGTAFMMRLYPFKSVVVTQLPSGTYEHELSANQFMSVPTSLVKVRRGNDFMSWGVGVFVPQAVLYNVQTSFSATDDVFGLRGASYLEGLEMYNQAFTYNIGPAVGFEITPRLRVGFSLFITYLTHKSASLDFVRLTGEDSGGTNRTAYGYESEQISAGLIGLKAAVGLQWEFVRNWHVGLVLRSPSFCVYRWGKKTETLTVNSLDGDFGSEPVFDYRTTDLEKLGFTLFEPMEVALAFGFAGERGWIGAEAGIKLPMARTAHCPTRLLLWNLSVGGLLKINDMFRVGSGFFTDRSPSEDPDTLGVMDVDFYGMTTGFEFRKELAVKGRDAVHPLVFSTTLAVRAALGFGTVGGFVFNIEDRQGLVIVPREVEFLEMSLHVGSALYF